MGNILNVKILSSLEKIYHGDALPKNDYTHFSMLKNEKKSFQVAVECNVDFSGKISLSSSIKNIKLYSVEYIKSDFPMVEWADDYFRFSEDGYYPDLLLPVENEIQFKKGINLFWVEVICDGSLVGKYDIDISICDSDTVSKNITVEIIDCELDFKDFVYTCWFHTDCLMSYYKIDAFSEEYWRIVENFLKTAKEYGQNCVLTPLFTPPLDTEIGKERPTVQLVDVIFEKNKYSFNFDKLNKWIETAHRCGIEYFEMSHFFYSMGCKSCTKDNGYS